MCTELSLGIVSAHIVKREIFENMSKENFSAQMVTYSC